ncbi:MAG: PAS domain-containing protein [Bacteroidetes bacterium]|nr:PAS domain-containing protein [Fibrella sp.]
MTLPQSYTEMLDNGINRPAEEGARPYPAAALEITLLNHAQQKAYDREASRFRQLRTLFDWQMSPDQQEEYLRQLKQGYTLLLTDSDRVIRWASQNFMRMTGHRVADVLGKKPSVLQGSATDWHTAHQIRTQLSRAQPVRADLLNYRKDGTIYTCRVAIDPLCNTRGELTHFLAVEIEVMPQSF